MSADSQKARFYVGTYTNMTWARGKKGKGIYRVEFDPKDGSMSCAACYGGPDNPSYLAFDSDHTHLYAANEIQPVDVNATGFLTAYKVDRDGGGLTLLSSVPSGGLSPCFVALDKSDSCAYVSNYSSGSVALFPVNADRSTGAALQLVQHEGSGPDKRRQETTHAHSVLLDNAEKFLFAADLGIDSVMVYAITEKDGKPFMAHTGAAKVNPGDGPRHMALSASGERLYVLCEMGSKIYVFDYDGNGELTKRQDIPTIPGGDSAEGNNCADIHISADGRHLYASNRGHDSIALFDIGQDGGLTFIRTQKTGGKTPRNFAFDNSGKYIVVANQDSDNIVSFAVDPATGDLSMAGELELPSPVCIKFTV